MHKAIEEKKREVYAELGRYKFWNQMETNWQTRQNLQYSIKSAGDLLSKVI